MRPFPALPAALAVLAVLAPARAHAEEDFQVWSLNVAQGRVSGDLVAYAEIQPRFTDDAGRLGQLLIRPAIGYQVSRDVQLLAGYAYVRTDPLGGEATDEHRYWQQATFPILKGPGGFTLNARTRLEQRTVVGFDDLGWRLRQQVRAQAPLRRGGEVSGIVWTEPFYNFDSTDWGAREGFDQVRTFVGVGVPLTPKLTFEPGYMNQTVFRRGEDRSNHIASVNLLYRF